MTHRCSLEKTRADHQPTLQSDNTLPLNFVGQPFDKPLFEIIGSEKTIIKLNLLLSMYSEEKDIDEQTILLTEFQRSVGYLEERGYRTVTEENKVIRLVKTST